MPKTPLACNVQPVEVCSPPGRECRVKGRRPLSSTGCTVSCNIGAGVIGQHQRGMENQLVDDRAIDVVTGPQHHIDEPGGREHHTVLTTRCPPNQL